MPPPRHIYSSSVSRRQRRRWRRQHSPVWTLAAASVTAGLGAAATLGLLQVLGV